MSCLKTLNSRIRNARAAYSTNMLRIGLITDSSDLKNVDLRISLKDKFIKANLLSNQDSSMKKKALTWKNSQTRSLLRYIITLEFPRFCREKFAHSDQREGSGWTPILIICLQPEHKKIIGSFQNQHLQGLQIKENQWIFRSRLKDSPKSKIERRRRVKICLITSTSARILIKNNQGRRTPTNLHTIRPCLNS